MTDGIYTEAQHAKLRTLRAEGLSYGKIAKAMRISKGAAIGLARRLGVAPVQSPNRQSAGAARNQNRVRSFAERSLQPPRPQGAPPPPKPVFKPPPPRPALPSHQPPAGLSCVWTEGTRGHWVLCPEPCVYRLNPDGSPRWLSWCEKHVKRALAKAA